MSDPITLPCFLTLDEADALAALLPGLTAFTAASPTERQQYLNAASDRVANAHPWQGSKIDPGQALPFPRYSGRPFPWAMGRPAGTAPGQNVVWDLDADTNEPVVPLDVKKATVYEAASIADGERARLTQAQHNGLAAQTTGSLSETYKVDAKGTPVLCEPADVLVRRFIRRSAVLT